MINNPESSEPVRLVVNSSLQYTTRLARNIDEIHDAQELRFQVFNLELNEGLEKSYATGRDEDAFDAVCEHLLVEHMPSATIVGTYRMQTGNTAVTLGYYSAQEFEFEVIGPQFKQQDKVIVVVGRLRTALKPAPLQPLLHALTTVELPTTSNMGTSSDEKVVTVNPTEAPKKTRKLKKPTIVDSNESLKAGMDEGSN